MQTNNRFFDDIARVVNGAAGAFGGIKGEVESMVKDRLERILGDMDMVTREEFDAVRAMVAKSRTNQEVLLKKIAALEAKLAPAKKPAAKKRPPKTAEAKSASK